MVFLKRKPRQNDVRCWHQNLRLARREALFQLAKLAENTHAAHALAVCALVMKAQRPEALRFSWEQDADFKFFLIFTGFHQVD